MFSLLSGSSASNQASSKAALSPPPPAVNVVIGRPSYHPGEQVVASISIGFQQESSSRIRILEQPGRKQPDGSVPREAVLLDEVIVEVKGIEKVDPSWVTTPRTPSGAGLLRGERLFLDSEPTVIASQALLTARGSKTWAVRINLPKVLPPSYRGTAVRYTYLLVATVKYAASEGSGGEQQQIVTRVPFQVSTLPTANGVAQEEDQEDSGFGGIVPLSPLEVEIQWREKSARSNWVAATEALSDREEDEEPSSAKLGSPFTSSRGQEDPAYPPALYTSLSMPPQKASTVPLEPSTPSAAVRRLSLSAVSTDPPPATPTAGRGVPTVQPGGLPTAEGSDPEEATRLTLPVDSVSGNGLLLTRTDSDTLSSPPRSPTLVSLRGRSYNIRIGDQLLVRFAPRSPQPTFTLGDVVSGTLDFSGRQEGERVCLKVSVLLESREIVAGQVLHASRKLAADGAVIPKIQCEYHEVSVNLLQTHFIFTIPPDAPQTFATPLVTVEWVLRFEFLASPPGWNQSEPSSSDSRPEKAEWHMPLTVHAPLPRVVTPAPKGAKKPGRLASPRKLREGGYKGSPKSTPPAGSPKVGSPRGPRSSRMSPLALERNRTSAETSQGG